ncbi:MAG: PIN domain-containing protein [Acidimicrobiia bacterium]|nr:PIN domain-containing protein [Acidimicrobiia bacterium]
MKIVDVNVLVYATDTATQHHEPAKEWLDRAMAATETVGIPWAVAIGYVRLTTNPRVLARPLAAGESIGIVRNWLDRSNVASPVPTSRHLLVLEDLLGATGPGGNLVSDAHLAALTIEHGATLCSFDNDFSRFPGLEWVSPADGA